MSNLLKSTAILAFARITNFSLVLLSPVLLVRFLDTYTFGQYREFMVYAMFVSTLAGFSVKSNLLYFIPQDTGLSGRYVNNTIWIILCTSTLACITLFVFREPIFSETSFNFLIPLSLYVLLFTNLDILESYWLANKQPDNVFYYSVTVTVVRLTAVLGTAMYVPSVGALLSALIAAEMIRVLGVIFIMRQLKLRLTFIDQSVIRRQLEFIIPLGVAATLNNVNQYIGQLAISTQLGVVALAIYTIGSYQIPILNIIRGSIGDSIFPDMVREASSKGGDRLRLWKRSNIAYTALIVPIFILLFCYADVLIPLVFTDQYAGAIPIFRILVTVMAIQCFEFSSPLRAANRNKVLLVSNVLLLCVNIAIILVFFRFFLVYAIYGPAIAIVCAYVVQLIFLGLSITQVYSIPLSELLKWHSLAKILLSAAISCIPLVIGELMDIPDLVRIPVFTSLFMVCYYFLVRRARLEEIERLLETLGRRFKKTYN